MHHIVEHGIETRHVFVRCLSEIVNAVPYLGRRKEVLEFRSLVELVADLALVEMVAARDLVLAHQVAQDARAPGAHDLELAVAGYVLVQTYTCVDCAQSLNNYYTM